MKILFCTNAFQNITNGPAKFANLILEINEHYPEHQVRILTEDINEEKLAGLKNVYAVRLRIPVLLKPFGQLLRMFQYYRQVREIEQNYPFDVLVYNNAFTGLYASRVSAKPTVGMINDDNNLAVSFRNFRFSRLWLKRFFFKQLERKSVHRHCYIITNSDYLTRQVQQAYQVSSAKTGRLYKAIDISKIPFSSNRQPETPLKILFVKADFMRGGLQVLAEALHLLPELNFILTVVGPPSQFRISIETMFKGRANVQLDFRGEQPQSVVKTLMQQYDLFCVPSLQEALGVANMEALAAGISVISTTAGGIPEVLDNGYNGWLVPPGHAAALASAIKDCINHPEKRKEKSETGRRFVERFSKEMMFENFLQILYNALQLSDNQGS